VEHKARKRDESSNILVLVVRDMMQIEEYMQKRRVHADAMQV
jgi:hypothetical protein